MRAVLISIQPKWCELIASGKKTIEVRKTKPKLETPFKVYIYCTKNTFDIRYSDSAKHWQQNACGKVIGEFVCDTIEEFKPVKDGVCIYYISENEMLRTGLSLDEMLDYADGKTMYHWHISDLVIYDKPKELREFCKVGVCPCDAKSILHCTEEMSFCAKRNLIIAPQSWCYVESEVAE